MAQSSLAFTGRLLTVAMLAVAAPALAESPAPEIVSPLVATPIAPPNPVLGADARRHLVYEIVLMDIGGKILSSLGRFGRARGLLRAICSSS
jgi:hypothetical protein